MHDVDIYIYIRFSFAISIPLYIYIYTECEEVYLNHSEIRGVEVCARFTSTKIYLYPRYVQPAAQRDARVLQPKANDGIRKFVLKRWR